MKMKRPAKKVFDAIVVGTGPGGAPVARTLAREGRSVLIIERGAYHQQGLGFPFGLRLLDGFGYFCKSEEGVYLARGITVGGSSMLYNANVYDPPAWLFDSMGIDFSREIDELKEEIGVRTLPDVFFRQSVGGNHIRETAERMGMHFKVQEKFIDADKCRIGCDWCMLGCRYGAKWTTRRMIEEAIDSGATLLTNTTISHCIIPDGKKCIGVSTPDGSFYGAEKIILAAGGVGTSHILINSGIYHQAENFFTDPMHVIFGYAPDRKYGAWGEMTFSHAIDQFKESDKFIIGNISAQYAAIAGTVRLDAFRRSWKKLIPLLRHGIGLFVKIADEPFGYIDRKGMHQQFTADDVKRMERGISLAKNILINSGIPRKSITISRWMGGHPGGTAAMGRIVDHEFQTEYENLYICDGSVIPSSPGAPPALSILALSSLCGKILTR